ncbi:MAG: M15 family metallopeptidase [Bacteroidota bacterium]
MLRLLSVFGGIILLLTLFACSATAEKSSAAMEGALDSMAVEPEAMAEEIEVVEVLPPTRDTSELEHTLIAQGLVDAAVLDSSLIVKMKYSTEDNFLGRDVYGDYDRCYLQPPVAKRLVKGHAWLKENHPRLRYILFDCVRPRSVQYQMWEIVKGTDQQNYVAPPGGGGSMHNYGAAVDMGLIHLDTGLVDMGTPFDYFGRLAQPRHENSYVKKGRLTQEQVENRRIMRASLLEAGFHGILSEWWHFVGFPRDSVRKWFKIVE